MNDFSKTRHIIQNIVKSTTIRNYYLYWLYVYDTVFSKALLNLSYLTLTSTAKFFLFSISVFFIFF